jgi:hypothetical protein
MAYPVSPMSTVRLLRQVLVAALLAVTSLALGVAVGVLVARSAGAHSCVGDWRVAMWHAAIEDSPTVIEVVRVDLVDEPLCSTPHVTPPTVPPPAPAADMAVPVSPPATAPPSAPTSGVEQWRGLVEAYFPPGDVERVLRIMACESGGNPNAKNPHSTASGLMQFIAGTWRWVAPQAGVDSDLDARFDPEQNIRAAAWLWSNGGPTHWSCKG